MSFESRLDAFDDRGVALVDPTGEDIVLWMRPNVNRASGAFYANHASIPYPDVARLSLEQQGESVQVELVWELHPRTVRVRSLSMGGGAACCVAAVAFAIATDIGLALAGVLGFMGLYAVWAGANVERMAWNPWPRVVEALDSRGHADARIDE